MEIHSNVQEVSKEVLKRGFPDIPELCMLLNPEKNYISFSWFSEISMSTFYHNIIVIFDMSFDSIPIFLWSIFKTQFFDNHIQIPDSDINSFLEMVLNHSAIRGLRMPVMSFKKLEDTSKTIDEITSAMIITLLKK